MQACKQCTLKINTAASRNSSIVTRPFLCGEVGYEHETTLAAAVS